MKTAPGDASHALLPKIVVVSHDVVGGRMAGPGIRYYQLGRVLSREFDVTLAIPCDVDSALPAERMHIISYQRGDWASLAVLLQGAAAVMINCVSVGDFPLLAEVGIPLIVDGYDPLLAEWLTMTRQDPQGQEASWEVVFQRLSLPYRVGDFFVCASERQRDWWLGLLEASGRINPWTMREDPSLRRLVNVVPFGLSQAPATHTRAVVRGVWPQVSPEDKIILWGGGLWPWMDPLTAIRAMAHLWRQRQDVRLIFPGTRHPNPAMQNAPSHLLAAQQLAGELGLADRAVLWGDWVAYADWANVLLESDLALSLHFEQTLETRWAFRTRILDYLWAGLPMVVTGGDATSEVVEKYGVGMITASQDAPGVAAALLQLLDQPRAEWAERFELARRQFTWESAAQPLLEFCRQPRRAPDRGKTAVTKPSLPAADVVNSVSPAAYAQLQEENTHLRALVQAFEQRKIVRFLNSLRRVFRR